MYGVAPWMLAQLADASGVAPFGAIGGTAGPGVRSRPLFQRIVAVGVLTALAAMASGSAVLVTPALGGGVGRRRPARSARCAVPRASSSVGFGGAVVAFVLHLPWSASFLHTDWASMVNTSVGRQPARPRCHRPLRDRTARAGRSATCSSAPPPSPSASAGPGAWAGRCGPGRSCWPASRWSSCRRRAGCPFDLPATEVLLVPGGGGLALGIGHGHGGVRGRPARLPLRLAPDLVGLRGCRPRARGPAGHRRDDRRPLGHAARRLRPRPVVRRQGRRGVTVPGALDGRCRCAAAGVLAARERGLRRTARGHVRICHLRQRHAEPR